MRKGLKWWNNGVVDVRSLECPGNEWVNGRLKVKTGLKHTEESKEKIISKCIGRKPKNVLFVEKHPFYGKSRKEHSKLMKNNFNLSGKYSLITGAGGLLGLQHALALAEINSRHYIEINNDQITGRANDGQILFNFSIAKLIASDCPSL
jgi:hypothetical protein